MTKSIIFVFLISTLALQFIFKNQRSTKLPQETKDLIMDYKEYLDSHLSLLEAKKYAFPNSKDPNVTRIEDHIDEIDTFYKTLGTHHHKPNYKSIYESILKIEQDRIKLNKTYLLEKELVPFFFKNCDSLSSYVIFQTPGNPYSYQLSIEQNNIMTHRDLKNSWINLPLSGYQKGQVDLIVHVSKKANPNNHFKKIFRTCIK